MSSENKKQYDSETAKLFRTRMDVFVLNALSKKEGQGYGYDVITYIQEQTKGHFKIKSISTIYNILKRLETLGYVNSQKGGTESNGAVRVYYMLTDLGREFLEHERREWDYIRTLLDNLVSDEDFDLDSDEPPYSASNLKPLTKRSHSDDSSLSEETEEESASPSPIEEDKEEIEGKVEISEKVPEMPPENLFALSDVEELPEMAEPNQESMGSNPILSPNQMSLFDEETDENSTESETNEEVEEIEEAVVASEPVLEEMEEKEELPIQNSVMIEDTLPPIAEEKKVSKEQIMYERLSYNETPKKVENEYVKINFINALRDKLKEDGFTLKTFTPKEKANTIKFYYCNKILLGTVLGGFLYLILALLVLYFFRSIFDIGLMTVHILAGIGLAGMVAVIISFCVKPNKRKKDVTNLKRIASLSFLVFLVVLMVSLIVYLLIPSGYSLTSPQIYLPAILTTTIPFSGCMYILLYKSGKFFVK